MDPTNCVPMNDEVPKIDASALDNCLLRYGLNVNCQLEVLKYLNLNDLTQVCNLDIYFEELINKWVIGKKLISLQLMAQNDSLQVFERFGKSIRRLTIRGDDFNLLLEAIMQYCSQAGLTEIQFILESRQSHDLNLIHRSMPFFSNLQKLRINNKYGCVSFEEFLNEIVVNASSLRTLQLRGVTVQGEWLRTKHMENLCELWLHTWTKVSIEDLTFFLREHPKLEVFNFSGNEDITVIGEILRKCCPDLKSFSYEDLRFLVVIDATTKRYNFLSSFQNLNTATLISSNSSLFPFITLARKLNVKLLKVIINYNLYTNSPKFTHMINSEMVEAYFEKDEPDNRQPCDVSTHFFSHLVSHLEHLESITFVSNRKLINLSKILELTPNIRTLSISEVTFKYLPVEIRKIVRCIRKIRKCKKFKQNGLHLIVNKEQWRELQVYDDIKSITTTTIAFSYKCKS